MDTSEYKYEFKVEDVTLDAVGWIRDWFKEESGNAKGIVLGISGGKDSNVAAALCCKAIGAHNVLGVLMPNGDQSDLDDAIDICHHLNIRYQIVDIKPIVDTYKNILYMSDEVYINILPRIRMTTLYAVAQSNNYRVCGTGNLSERTIGYFTKWGDGASDFNPLANLTATEVIIIGKHLGLPFMDKPPADGLTGMTDEEVLGIEYKDLDDIIRDTGLWPEEIGEEIYRRFKYSQHKREGIPCYRPALQNFCW